MDKVIDNIADTIRKNQRFLIAAHDNADGDSLGSELALALALKGLNKDVRVLLNGSIPARYRFLLRLRELPKLTNRVFSAKNKQTPDVLFILDTAGWNQIKMAGAIQSNKQTVINIDHHIDNKRFGDINWVDAKASAAGEQIYNLLKKLSIPLTKDIAICLYTAIVTDTGSFRYANTTPITHRIISHLLAYGIHPNIISERIYENIPLCKLKLLRLALKTLKSANPVSTGRDSRGSAGQIIYIWITRRMLKEVHAKQEDAEGFIDYLKAVNGVKIAIVFKENAKSGEVRVNFRSKDPNISVNEIAHQFGGGGHRAAAGCTLHGGKKEAEKKVINAAKLFLAACCSLDSAAQKG